MGHSRLLGHLILLMVVLSGCIQPTVHPITRAIIPAPTAANWSEDSTANTHWNGYWRWTIDNEWGKRQTVWKDWLPGKSDPKGLSIHVERAEGYAVEGYSLRIDDDGVSIEASEEAGAFHALTTLRWMLPQFRVTWKVGPCRTFPYRMRHGSNTADFCWIVAGISWMQILSCEPLTFWRCTK